MKKQCISFLAAMVVAAVLSPAVLAEIWKFGVMGDTQWVGTDPTGNNINSVAVNHIRAVNQQFINAGVAFVIQVGDLTDNGSTAAITTRANEAQALYNAGIGFFPLRGNHESSTSSSFITHYKNTFPQISGSANTFGATNFVSSSTSQNLNYAFRYNNATFALFDITYPPSQANEYNWLNGVLSNRPSDTHAFVFAHKNLLGQSHKDNVFGSGNDSNLTAQNALIGILDNNDVRYFISGHDHMHHRSQVNSPNGQASVQQIICASNSYKYYTPANPVSARELPFAQELYRPGYYIYTVDGPRVTVEYYSTTKLSNGDIPANPVWSLQEVFGYSLNGKQFTVAAGGDLSVVQDSFGSTTMRLSGINASTKRDYLGRLLYKDINTGWTERPEGFASDILTLWGMEDLGSSTTAAPFTLTMSYLFTAEDMYIAKKLADGTWQRLASMLNGDGTISAVVNAGGTFVVVPEPATLALMALGLVAVCRRNAA